MRLKSINVNGRRLGAIKEVVQTVGRNGSNPQPELTFDDMDEILAAMEKNEATRIDMNTQTTGYYPEIRESECGGGKAFEGLVLAFGCWEVGNLEEFKKVYAQLKELNKDPEIPANTDVIEVGGQYLTVQDKVVYLCDEVGHIESEITTVEDLQKIIVEMEHVKQLPIIRYTGRVADIRKGSDGKVYLTIGCVVKDLDAVKATTNALAEIQKKQEVLTKPAGSNAQAAGC